MILLLKHLFIILGIGFVLLPIYLAFIASTHDAAMMFNGPPSLIPGKMLFKNYQTVLWQGDHLTSGISVYNMMKNSLYMAALIAFGKIFCAVISAYAMVFFDFPFKKTVFCLIVSTLMLPVEVRIVPTFQVVAGLNLLNSFTGLTLPLIASATATFMFRQFFKTIPSELAEAARLDGAGPVRFFWDILLPLSKTNIAALFIIMFIYGWNQFLWPLVVTTDANLSTIVMGIQNLASVADEVPQWQFIMTISVCAMLPPLLVIIFMQNLFEKGLFEVEK